MCIFQKYREKYNFEDFFEAEQIEDFAEEVLNFTERKEVPTKIVEILRMIGFKIYSAHFKENDISGLIGINDSFEAIYGVNKIIKLNAQDNIGHKRFTLAHELAHYIFDYSGQGDYVNAYRTDYLYIPLENHSKEARANRFAAAILMPKHQFILDYNKVKNQKNFLEELANSYLVSVRAIEMRIEELNLKKSGVEP